MPDTTPPNPHFESLADWTDAVPWMGFEPRVPSETLGRRLESLAVFVRDHKMREVPVGRRSLEAHYDGFVWSQSQPGEAEARLAVCETSYGSDPRTGSVGRHEARVYELGPEPPPDDIDPRMPAVVVWWEGARFFLVASDTLSAAALVRVAESAAR